MDIQNFIKKFPWNRFSHAYGLNATDIKNKFLKIFEENGTIDPKDNKFIMDRIENQETLFWITPWILKIFFAMLGDEKYNKKTLLENIETIFEAANYTSQGDVLKEYKPTKRMLEKYSMVKVKLYDNDFDGTFDADYLKICKSLDRSFIHIEILDYIIYYKNILEKFIESYDNEISEVAKRIIESINNPKNYIGK